MFNAMKESLEEVSGGRFTELLRQNFKPTHKSRAQISPKPSSCIVLSDDFKTFYDRICCFIVNKIQNKLGIFTSCVNASVKRNPCFQGVQLS